MVTAAKSTGHPSRNLLQLLGLKGGVPGHEMLLDGCPVLEGGQGGAERAGQPPAPLHDSVDVKAAGLAEPLAAAGAVEGPGLGVRVLVVPEMVLPPEGLAADITGKGSLVRVRALVDHEVVGLGELAMAKLADEPLLWSCSPLMKGSGSMLMWRRVQPVPEQQGLVDVGQDRLGVMAAPAHGKVHG